MSLLNVLVSVIALLIGNASCVLITVLVYRYKNVELNNGVIFIVGITCSGAVPTEN